MGSNKRPNEEAFEGFRRSKRIQSLPSQSYDLKAFYRLAFATGSQRASEEVKSKDTDVSGNSNITACEPAMPKPVDPGTSCTEGKENQQAVEPLKPITVTWSRPKPSTVDKFAQPESESFEHDYGALFTSTYVTGWEQQHDAQPDASLETNVNELNSKLADVDAERDQLEDPARDLLKNGLPISKHATSAVQEKLQQVLAENSKLKESSASTRSQVTALREKLCAEEEKGSNLEKELQEVKHVAVEEKDHLVKILEGITAELDRLRKQSATGDAGNAIPITAVGDQASLSSSFLSAVRTGVFRVRKDTEERSTSALKRAEELTRELIRHMNLERVSYVRQVVPTDLDAEVTASLDAKYKDATAGICMKYFDSIKDLQKGTTDSTTKSWTTFLQRLDTIVQSSPSTAIPPQTSTTPSQAASPPKLPTCPITPSSSFNANTCPSPTPNPSSDNEVLYSHTVRKPRIFDLTLEEADEQADHASELAAMRAHYERLLDKAHAATAAAKAFSGMMGCARAVLNIGERFGDVSGRGM